MIRSVSTTSARSSQEHASPEIHATRTHRPERAHFIPKGAIKIVPHGISAEVYIYERRGVPCAMVFAGKQQRPGLHVQYANSTRREKAVREYLENLARVKAYKDEQAAKRAGFKHGFKVGDILHYSWGYDQTQCEFYEVIATTPGTITIREIGQETVPGSTISHGMADSRTATPGQFLVNAEPMVKRPQYSESGPGYVPMAHGCASPWDGRPKYCSWYA